MTNPTSNFGWQMPTSTDLVTDLPADFETFGQAVDTSLADLKGGTSGQILSKASNTDMDFTWVTNDVGDITAVTAGTGISGGGTSGDVTITNSMATAIDAKGDLIAGTGADAFSRLAVGTNGQVLTADSTAANGLKYAAAVSGWTSYTPTYTNLTVGNGTTNAAVYRENGDMIDVFIRFTFGSTTSITGSLVSITLPTAHDIPNADQYRMGGRYLDSGVRDIPAYCYLTASTIQLKYAYINFNGSGVNYEIMSNITSTEPWTWTTNDQFSLFFSYRKG